MIKVDRLKFNIIFRFSLAFFLISIYILAVKDYSVVVILPCMVFLLGIYFSVKDIYNNIFLFSFLICFFTFLLGGQLLDKFINVYGYDFFLYIVLYIFLILFLTNDIPIAHCYKPFVKVLRIPLNTRPHNKQFAFTFPPFFCLLLTYEIKR